MAVPGILSPVGDKHKIYIVNNIRMNYIIYFINIYCILIPAWLAEWKLLDHKSLMTNPITAFTQFSCVSGHFMWITRENAN